MTPRPGAWHARPDTTIGLAAAPAPVNLGVWALDMDARVLRPSLPWVQLFGAPGDGPLTLEAWLAFIDRADRSRVELELKTYLAGLCAHFDTEFRARGTDGDLYWIRCHGVAKRDEKGVVHTMEGHHEDITARKALEEALRRSEARFRLLVERAPDAIAVLREGRFVFANRRLLELLGYDDPSQLEGRLLLEAVHPDDATPLTEDVRALVAGVAQSVTREVRLFKRDRSTLAVEMSTVALAFEGEPAVFAFARDISERKRMQSRMADTERMASLGTLAAGVAHEINNPLSYVMTNIQMMVEAISGLARDARELRARFPGLPTSGEAARLTERAAALLDPATFEDLLDLARDAVHGSSRVHALVSDLRIFGRTGDDKRGPVELRTVVDLALKIVDHQIRQRARVTIDTQPGLVVEGSEGRFCQLFVNLLVNATQAIESGHPSDNEIAVRLGREGGTIVAQIRDTGCGIKPEHMPRLFDPFFTTKPVGVGSGLGLPICWQIVEDAGGRILVDSEVGKGTTITVRLPVREGIVTQPLHEGSTTSTTSEGPAFLMPGQRRHRILIVDDEPALLRSLDRELGKQHEVVLAASGREAIEHLSKDPGYSIILCDLVMADVNGREVFEWVKQRDAALADRIVFITGGATDDAGREFLEQIDNLVLFKPVELKKLRRLVKSLIAEAALPGVLPPVAAPTAAERAATEKEASERRAARRFRADEMFAAFDGFPSAHTFRVVDYSASGLRFASPGQWEDWMRDQSFDVVLNRGNQRFVHAEVRFARLAPRETGADLCVKIEAMDEASHDTYQTWLAGAS